MKYNFLRNFISYWQDHPEIYSPIDKMRQYNHNSGNIATVHNNIQYHIIKPKSSITIILLHAY